MTIEWPLIRHRNFQRALLKAQNAAIQADSGQCILITGPTGAGKSEVLYQVLNTLVGAPDTWPPGELHYIQVDCDRSSPANITRNLVIDLNRAFHNPFVSLPVETDLAGAPRYRSFRTLINEHDLRGSFRALGAIYKTRYVGLDAMEHIQPSHPISGEARFDSIKSLALPHKKHVRAHEMVLIMGGHYSLLSYWRANTQLARRVSEIYVAPYQRTREDILQWEYILQTVDALYPLDEGSSLRLWNDLLFDLSAGCIGILKKLLDDAVVEMNVCGHRSLLLDHIAAAAPPRDKLEQIRQDVERCWPYFESSVSKATIDQIRSRTSPTGSSLSQGKKRRPGRVAGPRDKVGKKA